MRSPEITTPSLPPLVDPGPELTVEEIGRFARHLALPGLGADGQRRLAATRVLVVGAGGLGSPALLYLAAAGVGTLGVVDDDVVDASNLQRQVLHGTGDVGRAKTTSAREAVADVAPGVRCVEHAERLTPANALDLLRDYDLVLDGSDNFATRYLVADAAEILGLPVVWGGLYQFQGQVSVFWAAPPVGEGVTYRDVFPEPPPAALAPDCATGGVLGSLCGTIGSAMATEAVKLITGTGRTLLGRLAVHDALDASWRHLDVRADPSREPVTTLPDDAAYATLCGLGPVEPVAAQDGPVTPATVAALRAAAADGDGDEPYIVDVREPWEVTIAAIAGADLVGLGELLGPDRAEAVRRVADRAQGRPVHVLCKMGGRAAQAAAVLRDAGLPAREIAGGILAWSNDVDPSIPTY
ncbi:ThiF family adenylyltransferase [Isoptericola croceus]|uniref:ThiF family adenylyltransferase n=1 Tax=Isoptericola croceus TaxID=3031406 RepID=UPI0023F6A641|nr:ThiF family adenylyltransferase [Isoptericola croceus]